jgi:hypothetical protein
MHGVGNMRIRLTCDIIEPLDCDHPDLWYASKGTEGELHTKDKQGYQYWPAYIKLDNGTILGLKEGEYELLPG